MPLPLHQSYAAHARAGASGILNMGGTPNSTTLRYRGFAGTHAARSAGADYLKSVGGNKKQVAKPSFLRSFQSKEKGSQSHDTLKLFSEIEERILSVSFLRLRLNSVDEIHYEYIPYIPHVFLQKDLFLQMANSG